MALREFVLNNFRWKLTALLLAMMVWFVIRFAMNKGITGGRSQVLAQQPIMVLKTPEDPRTFHIQPAQVDLVVQATKELHADDLEVFVNLTTLSDVDKTYKQVLVRGADAARVLAVRPWGVTVQRVAPGSSSTNASK